MTDYQQKVSDSFNERKRLIRLRRKKENLRFWDEFRIIPRWLMVLVALLYVIALVIAILVNLAARHNPYGNDMFPPELRYSPALASLALAGIVTAVSLILAGLIFMVAYVNRDSKRRGMNSALWTLLVLILSPGWLIIGFVIYFLMREPMPYSCPQCKREVVETDRFCPYCAYELGRPEPEVEIVAKSSS